MPGTDSTVILPHHFQQAYQRVQVALEQLRSNLAPAGQCPNEPRTMTSAGIHPSDPATFSSLATSHSMSHNATNIQQQRSTTTKRQSPSKPSTQSSNMSRVVKRGSSSNQQVSSLLSSLPNSPSAAQCLKLTRTLLNFSSGIPFRRPLVNIRNRIEQCLAQLLKLARVTLLPSKSEANPQLPQPRRKDSAKAPLRKWHYSTQRSRKNSAPSAENYQPGLENGLTTM